MDGKFNTPSEAIEYLDSLGVYHNLKELAGRIFGTHEFLFTSAILEFSIEGARHGYDDRWCYEKGQALPALEVFDGVGEPAGWHRHPSTGRRREHGDSEKETVYV